MFVELKERVLQAYAAKAQTLSRESDALKAAGRADEANLLKVSRNIFSTFHDLLAASPSAKAFEAHLATVPESWPAARHLAQTHQDHARVAAEDAKLSALRQIIAIYQAQSGQPPRTSL